MPLSKPQEESTLTPEVENPPPFSRTLGFGPELGLSFDSLKKAKDPESLYRLAICCLNGWGTEKLEYHAKKHLEEAVKLGHVGASWLLLRFGIHYNTPLSILRETLLTDAQSGSVLSAGEFYLLGTAFDTTRDPNLEKAIPHYQQAADKGHVKAMKRLAHIYSCADQFKDEKAAHALHLKLAQRGNVKFIEQMGYDYRYGVGVDESKEKAFQWYRRAEAEGSRKVFVDLAGHYDCAQGIPQDLVRATGYYQKALLQWLEDKNFGSFAIYISSYARCRRKRDQTVSDEAGFQEALSWIKESGLSTADQEKCYAKVRTRNSKMMRLVDSGERTPSCGIPVGPALGEYFPSLEFEGKRRPESAYRLALCYFNAWGTTFDESKGKEALEFASLNGYLDASWELLQRRLKGLYTSNETFQQALATLEPYCENPNDITGEQFFLLGTCFEKIADSREECQKAVDYYEKARNLGSKEAKKRLIALYRRLDQEALAFPIAQELAEEGDRKAMQDLAHFYYCGFGTEKNELLALEWYKRGGNEEDLTRIMAYTSEIPLVKKFAYFIQKKNRVTYAEVAERSTEIKLAIQHIQTSRVLSKEEKERFFHALESHCMGEFAYVVRWKGFPEALKSRMEVMTVSVFKRYSKEYAQRDPAKRVPKICSIISNSDTPGDRKQRLWKALEKAFPNYVPSSCLVQ